MFEKGDFFSLKLKPEQKINNPHIIYNALCENPDMFEELVLNPQLFLDWCQSNGKVLPENISQSGCGIDVPNNHEHENTQIFINEEENYEILGDINDCNYQPIIGE